MKVTCLVYYWWPDLWFFRPKCYRRQHPLNILHIKEWIARIRMDRTHSARTFVFLSDIFLGVWLDYKFVSLTDCIRTEWRTIKTWFRKSRVWSAWERRNGWNTLKNVAPNSWRNGLTMINSLIRTIQKRQKKVSHQKSIRDGKRLQEFASKEI